MKVVIKYYDDDALAPEEVIARAKRQYGEFSKVEVYPDSSDFYNLTYFAIQKHITSKQVDAYFHDGALYDAKARDLKREVICQIEEIINQVIKDNESRFE